MRASLALLAAGVWLRLALAATRGRDHSVDLGSQGTITGREVQPVRGFKAIMYLKIKYAMEPAIFMPPNMTVLPELDKPADSSEWPPACPQDKEDLERTHRFFTGHERYANIDYHKDCLYLNIFTPDGSSPTDGWPVMVWIHPGEFVSGAISLWDGSFLAAKQKVIVVTIAYRLNMYGFWTDGYAKYPGNYGLLDQVAALKWIKTKISLFKGSPNDICLFGYDAGAVSIGLHMMSNLPPEVTFNRAIAMSGNPFIMGAVKNAKAYEEYRQEILKKFKGVCSEKELSQCLSRLQELGKFAYGHWGPVMNSNFMGISNIPTEVYVIGDIKNMMDGAFKKVDFLTGYTQMEDVLSVLDDNKNKGDKGDMDKGITEDAFKRAIEDVVGEDVTDGMSAENDTCSPNPDALHAAAFFYYYPQPTPDEKMLREKLINLVTERKYGASTYMQALAVSKAGAKTYMYRFDYKLKTKIPNTITVDSLTVPHYYDLPLVWGMTYYQAWQGISAWNNLDRKFTDTIMQLWTNFAKTSNPISSGVTVKWDMFNGSSPGIMLLDRNPNMTDPQNPQAVDYKAFTFWNQYYPAVKLQEIGCCNTTAGGSHVHYEPVTVAIWTIFIGTQCTILN